jgi:hypothetical protein
MRTLWGSAKRTMKVCSHCTVSLPESEFYRFSNGCLRPMCKLCHRVSCAFWRSNNREKDRAYEKTWRENNREKRLAAKTQWRENNREKCRAAAKQRRINNPGMASAQALLREKHIKRATPPWADKKAMEQFYRLAAALSTPDQPYQVDHIIPLRGKTVSGLHVETNLRVITAEENAHKSNKF